jgi:hypothetical protein
MRKQYLQWKSNQPANPFLLILSIFHRGMLKFSSRVFFEQKLFKNTLESVMLQQMCVCVYVHSFITQAFHFMLPAITMHDGCLKRFFISFHIDQRQKHHIFSIQPSRMQFKGCNKCA